MRALNILRASGRGLNAQSITGICIVMVSVFSYVDLLALLLFSLALEKMATL